MSRQKDRGYRWEKEVADFLNGERKRAGPGVDVVARGYNVECKSRQDYDGLMLLLHWIEQAETYNDPFVLAISLGMRNKKRRLVLTTLEEWERITRRLEELEGG